MTRAEARRRAALARDQAAVQVDYPLAAIENILSICRVVCVCGNSAAAWLNTTSGVACPCGQGRIEQNAHGGFDFANVTLDGRGEQRTALTSLTGPDRRRTLWAVQDPAPSGRTLNRAQRRAAGVR